MNIPKLEASTVSKFRLIGSLIHIKVLHLNFYFVKCQLVMFITTNRLFEILQKDLGY